MLHAAAGFVDHTCSRAPHVAQTQGSKILEVLKFIQFILEMALLI